MSKTDDKTKNVWNFGNWILGFIWDLGIEIWILDVTLSYGYVTRARSRHESGDQDEGPRGC